MKKILLALLAFMSISYSAFASDWVCVGEIPDEELVYLDKESVVRLPGKASGWTKYVMANGGKALFNFSVRERDRTIAIVSFAFYDETGNVAGQYTYTYLKYNPVVPDSMMEIIYNNLVTNRKK